MSPGRAGPALVFVAPGASLLLVFFALPVAASALLSLTDFDVYAVANWRNLRFVGLENYRRLVSDPLFRQALANTAQFVFVAGPLTVVLALVAALLLDASSLRGRAFFRTVFFVPVVTTLVAVAVVWRYLYHPRHGLLNVLLVTFGIAPIDWLGDPAWAMPALILLAAWKNFGFGSVILLAALQAIPRSLYEAASLDGANRWRQVWHVTLPLLAPTLWFVSVLTMIGYFQLFAEPYVMTQGGPAGATRSVMLLVYEQGFRWWNLGYAAAAAFVLFAILVVLTALLSRVGGVSTGVRAGAGGVR